MGIFTGSKKREGKVTIETLDSKGRNIYVISDLHIASGLNANGNYDGTENFYADQSFSRFIDYLQEKVLGKTGILIINGDFVDFLRIRDIPKKDDDFRCWQEILHKAGIEKTTEELRHSIVDKEVKYGLKTNDYKSIWKLYCCIQGHKILFRKLAEWLYNGNELIIVKGNHDLEWYWPRLQTYLRNAFVKMLADDSITDTSVKDRIRFIDDALLIDKKIYVEHGHQYEHTTAVVGEPTFNNGEELTLPFGSFFNRYLINRIELSYPFIDNVRPQQNILSILLRERFDLALVLIFNYVPFALRIIPKKLYRHTFKYLLNFLFIVVLPVVITIVAIWLSIKNTSFGETVSGKILPSLKVAQNLIFLFLSYLFGRIIAKVGLSTPPTFSVFANDFLNNKDSMQYTEVVNKEVLQDAQIEAVLMGHTHDPEQRNLTIDQELVPSQWTFERSKPKPKTITGQKAKWYFNTGTWIPILEMSSADVREDKTYTFIAINCNEEPPCFERLQRWNDDAVRADTLILNDKI